MLFVINCVLRADILSQPCFDVLCFGIPDRTVLCSTPALTVAQSVFLLVTLALSLLHTFNTSLLFTINFNLCPVIYMHVALTVRVIPVVPLHNNRVSPWLEAAVVPSLIRSYV